MAGKAAPTSPLDLSAMQRFLTLSLLVIASLFAVKPAIAAADKAEEGPQNRIICDRKGNYPDSLAAESREGWVDLRFTMKPDGSFTDIEIISAFGEPYFAQTAKEAITSCRYERPELIGPPGFEYRNLRTRYYFRLANDNKGSTEKVYKKINESKKLMDEGKIDESEEILNDAEKESRKLYEYSHIMIRRAFISAARGNNNLSLSYLYGISKNKSFIEKKEFAQLLRMRLTLEVMEGQYVLAEKTAAEMAERPRDGDDKLLAQLALLKQTVTSGKPVSVNGQIPVNCHPAFCDTNRPEWFYAPYNRTVSLADIQGQLDDVILRCDRKTAIFKAEAGITWTIPKSWGECKVHVVGKPGATFKLIDETL
jgi:TonB family protein